MQSLDLFAEFANQPPVVKKQQTEPAFRPINGKRNVTTDRIEYEQWGKELRVTDRKTGRYQRMELRGLLYPTLLENLFWRFKTFCNHNANEFVTYQFMRQILSHDDALTEKAAIEKLVHQKCKNGEHCKHIGKTTWDQHLNDCIRAQ